jgi:hypothetical protein
MKKVLVQQANPHKMRKPRPRRLAQIAIALPYPPQSGAVLSPVGEKTRGRPGLEIRLIGKSLQVP